MAEVEEGRSARKRAQIVEAARSVFLRNGYVGASMDEVASLASVSKQTVYKQFTDKEQLFAHLVISTAGELDGVIKVVAATLDNTEDLERDLGRLTRAFLDRLLEPDVLRLRRLIIAEADRFPDLGRSWYELGFEPVLATLSAGFQRLAERGLLHADDPYLAANHLMGLLLWIPVNRAMFCGGASADYSDAERAQLATSAVQAFLRAYGAK
ncbi:TetR/AcrR family transcriptional regulator [Nonomuraea sp. NPDC050310]|uniref:TetR/AcrR family transcriptional regulator n=1 Tax=unclassified Nonomuraea TaxID=2593643 RepID=UPI0033F0B4A1